MLYFENNIIDSRSLANIYNINVIYWPENNSNLIMTSKFS